MSATLTITSDKGQTLVRMPDSMDVSLSNRNADDVLNVLGFPAMVDGISEIMPVQEMWAACNRYLSSELGEFVDTGKDTVQSGNFVDCGRDAGYFSIRVEAIRKALEYAMQHNGLFCYFA